MAIPTLFVIGDSISVDYGPYLEAYLAGVLNVTRKPGDEEALRDLDHPAGSNGGDSSMVLDYLSWLRAIGFHTDVLQVNCGLHDVRVNLERTAMQVPIDRYEENLRRMVEVALPMCDRLVWVRTTHVDEEMHNASGARGFLRFNADIDAYNAAADGIAQEAGIAVADLHTFTRNTPGQAFRDGVHFTDEAEKLQAAFLAGFHGGQL